MNYAEIMEKAKQNLREKGLPMYLQHAGAETGYVAISNVEFFKTLAFKMRIIDTEIANTDFEIFGQRLKTPIMSAALSHMGDIAKDPLVKIAQGVKKAGSMMWLGMGSEEELEKVIAVGAPVVKIVKPYKDSKKILDKLKHAEEKGAVAVGIDIDFFFGGKMGDMALAPEPMGPKTKQKLKEFKEATHLPFVLKGVLSAEDAQKAKEIGASCIIVSNHGGAVLDYAAHPLEVLPEIKKVVGDHIVVLVDSGLRRGTDVIKALALGADGILLGHLLLMGLAANEVEGVRDILQIIASELQRAMSITGCKKLTDIGENILYHRTFGPLPF